ncbi:MAG TPA: aminotransferase class V-fold PLP-dependent enzyme [Thermoanaerobaculia bacterium]|nr:aminotransferase class V-fold PLP-dependent enzyme [Thermoanaerobaculia bacterium]
MTAKTTVQLRTTPMNKYALRKEMFPVTDHCVYFNHAAVGPLSTPAYQAMEKQARDQRDYGALHWREWYGEYVHYRREASRLIGSDPGEISILKNTSEGISFVAEGLRWERGDNVITTDMEFPSNYVPWKRLERRGVECRQIRSRQGEFFIEDIEPLIDARTRLLTVSSVSFHNGFAPDLVALGQLCRDRNILLCVDAIQSLGAMTMNVREMNISFLAADGHKWMLGPEGTALFFVAAEAREMLEVFESGWTNIDRGGKFIGCETGLLNDGRRFEAGSANTIGIYGARASLGLLNGIGIDVIEREVVRLANLLRDRLHSIGFVSGLSSPTQSGIVGVTPPVVDLDRLRQKIGEIPGGISDRSTAILLLHRWLEIHDIICAPREGMLRFSPHFYNDEREIERVVEVLAEAL